jgi:hypothetical protein
MVDLSMLDITIPDKIDMVVQQPLIFSHMVVPSTLMLGDPFRR